MNSRQLNCESIAELLSPYIDGRVTEAEGQAVEMHIADCPRCAGELDELRLMVRDLLEMPTMRVPRSFALPAAQRKPVIFLPYLRVASAALAAIFLVIFASSFYLQASSTSQQTAFSAASRPALALPNSTTPNSAFSNQSKRAPASSAAAPAAQQAAPSAGAASQAAAPAAASVTPHQGERIAPLAGEGVAKTKVAAGGAASLPLQGIALAALALFIASAATSLVLWRR